MSPAAFGSPPPTPASPDGLDSLTKAQLIEMANEMGVEGVSLRMKKAEIINAIEEGGTWQNAH